MTDKIDKKENAFDISPFDLVMDYLFTSREEQFVPDLGEAMKIYEEATKSPDSHPE